MHAIREVMVVRFRELYGTTLGDPSSVVRVTLDRGIVMYFWNLPAARRLPLRAYVAGFTLKNGVPINYVEAIVCANGLKSASILSTLPAGRNRVDLCAGAVLSLRVHRRDDDLCLSLSDRTE